jgi:hypothetical protein
MHAIQMEKVACGLHGPALFRTVASFPAAAHAANGASLPVRATACASPSM